MIDDSLTGSVTTELLKKYDRPGPRYTSYPTAIEFHEGFGPAEYLDRLEIARRSPEKPLSLYIHLPFCHQRCTFCGCTVIITRKEDVSQDYLDTLMREIPLVAERLGDRRKVVQYHWGGGTPTYQTILQMRALDEVVRRHFDIAGDAEVAIEVDPRITTGDQLTALRELGFNRLSMGVQDFSPDVQEAINRGQTLAETEALFEKGRELGYGSINLDLVYGLPLQTPERFEFTLEHVIRLRPDRVACYSFAHIPWIRGNQRRIEKDDLPTAEEKFSLFGTAIRGFIGGGYRMIGMDHFALPGDEMAIAAENRRLHRNFMGYTVMPASGMIGLGVSSIGDLEGAYVQNTKKLSRYQAAIDAGELPVEKGYLLTADDTIRRDVITRLMCNFYLDVKGVQARHGIDFADYFAEELAALEEPAGHGFVSVTADAISVIGAGRLFIRNVCMIFDVHTRKKRGERPMFSRTV